MLVVENISNRELVHQRCILLAGYIANDGNEVIQESGSVEVQNRVDGLDDPFPSQSWPLCQGYFKALVMLRPGTNFVRVSSDSCSVGSECLDLSLCYAPLIQRPPLYLAILVAADSPLLIDCPPRKFGSLSSAHSGIEAAVAKLRLAAYMWQALTAEDLRKKGLGRRSFRLEEEYLPDTTSKAYTRGVVMQATAKVHLIRTEKTVEELRDANIAQQNPNARDKEELHNIFSKALKAHGGPFISEAKPVVAGMILDSTFDIERNLLLGHAALGAHDPKGLSLGIFGSHLTYSWPRFLEEVPDCLLDVAPPGDRVANDNGECTSMWEACAVGQGAFLHEVGHAFSAPHSSGIMTRGYSKDWPKCFLSRTSDIIQTGEKGAEPVTDDTPHDCIWDIRDALRFVNLPHFHLSVDDTLSTACPTFKLDEDDKKLRVTFKCEAGIGQVLFDGVAEPAPTVQKPATTVSYTINEIEARFNLEKPVSIEVLGMNGKHVMYDVSSLFSSYSYVRVPGTSLRLQKKSAAASEDPYDAGGPSWDWGVMFKARDRRGQLVAMSKLDLRVGCVLDGVIVHYQDGTRIPCGPRGKDGKDLDMGGHQSKKIAIPHNVDVVKVAVSKQHGTLGGIRVWLSNGKAMGALNSGSASSVEVLTPDDNERIIGFYGTSSTGGFQSITTFGIVTAPKDQEIPDAAYDIPELQNDPKRKGRHVSKRRRIGRFPESETEDTESDEASTSEDSDTGYDDLADVEFGEE